MLVSRHDRHPITCPGTAPILIRKDDLAMRARRSLLSVPGDRPRFHEKAQQISADEVMFDLEDSVAPANKENARGLVAESLQRFEFPGKTVAVRVNQTGTPWFEADVAAAASSSRVDTIVLPKVGSAAEVRAIEALLTRLGRPIGLEVQIESASGLEHAGEIAAASELVEVLHLGPFDLAASLGTPSGGSEIPEELYVHGLIRVLTAARASGRQAIDGPFTGIQDLRGLERSARRAARLGYDGKWAIHPDQVAVINATFTPSEAEVQRARLIIQAYEQSLGKGHGAITLDGEMLDEAIRRWAVATLAKANL
jgi:citrate lyase subunit beta/citryl-CoA lyase